MTMNKFVIKPEHWTKETDGVWYTHIPFDAKGEDTLIKFTSSEEYIQEHKEDFDALISGYTTDNECVIKSDHCPNCDIEIQISFCKDEDGEIIYKQDENGNFKPEWRENINIENLLGSISFNS